MKVFSDYADFYDLIYSEKAYAAESEFIHSCIQELRPKARKILEFGSGTGKHALNLATLGYAVWGIDRSPKMVAKARQLSQETLGTQIPFVLGDIRKKKLPETFDVGISLFHVMSYLISNQDFIDALKNMADHLVTGGIFLFDTWYGPAVLTTPPAHRCKKLDTAENELIRFSQPELLVNQNRVDVQYDLWMKNNRRKTVQTTQETHSMRYFFQPEIELMLEIAGFSLISGEEFMTRNPLGSSTWGALWIAQKKK